MAKLLYVGIAVGVGVIIVIIIAVPLAVLLPGQSFEDIFMDRCERFKKTDECQKIFTVFKKAYVGKPHCSVYVDDYQELMSLVPFKHPCNKTMLWSETKGLVHEYTSENKDCFTLEDTLLGYTLDDLSWCGKTGSDETYTTNCPGFNDCENNPVRSFWDKASAEFAEYACGEVAVMLDGSLENPFDPNGTFGSVELKRLMSPKVTRLNAILVNGHKSVCASQNLQTLKNSVNSGVGFTCKEVPESRIKECASYTNMGCGACLLKMTDDGSPPYSSARL